MSELQIVDIYTDGACKGNGRKGASPGGYGAILIFGGNTLEVKGSKSDTTNNEMEFAAVWAALSQLTNKNFHFKIHLDSAHVMDTFQTYIVNYRKNGYLRADKKPIKNQKLIMLIDEQLKSLKSYEFVKVKGHSGVKWNERADELANIAVAELIKSNAEKVAVVEEKDVYGLVPNRRYTGIGKGALITFDYVGNNMIEVISARPMIEEGQWKAEEIIAFNNTKPQLTTTINPSTIQEIILT